VAVIEFIVHSVMKTKAHRGSNTAYSAQCYEHSSLSAENDDACQTLTLFMCVLIHHPHLAHHTDIADSTTEPSVVPSASKPPPPPKPSLYESVPVTLALGYHSLPQSIGQKWL